MDSADDRRVALIQAIYGAALAPDAWGGVLDSLMAHFDAAAASFGVMDSGKQIVLVARRGITGTPEMTDRYRSHYVQYDPWPPEMARRAVGEAMLSSRVYDPEFMRQSPFVNEYFLPAGLVDSMGASLLRDDQNTAILAIQRSVRRGTFQSGDIARFNAISPHLTAAIRVQRGLSGMAQGGLAEQVLDRLAVGVVALNGAGQVDYANVAANRMLARRDGLLLDDRTLIARDPVANDRLGRLLAEVLSATSGAGGIVQVRRAAEAGRYAMLVAPLRRERDATPFPWPYRGALVLIRDEESGWGQLPDQLRALYGLSVEQARLLQALLDGATLLEHAERAGVRPTTARFHLRHVLQKTGTASQSQLMRKVVGDLAGLPLLR
jgi:DNA-binding CsgD family transcriptional regulator/PAS domain-containing protein